MFATFLSLQATSFHQVDPENFPDLYTWSDTCNVHVLRQGSSALLINLGDGSVLDHLSELGVDQVDWVLFTQHQRENVQGAHRLDRSKTQVAAPEAERALFERPTSFRKVNVRLGDRYTVHGASYVRPSIRPIALDSTLHGDQIFRWKSLEFLCLNTPGNSPGGMSFLLKQKDQWIAFTGGLMMADARMSTWYDSEWDYGFAAGLWALANSVSQVSGYRPVWLLPSQGPSIQEARADLEAFQKKLFRLERLLVRGYPVNSFANAIQDRVSTPSRVPNVWQVSPSIFKFRALNFFGNFYLILAPSGHALVVDCGLLSTDSLDAALRGLQKEYGLKKIDAVIPTHMHGDHFLQAPHLREKWGAEIWGTDRMVDVCANPEWFDYAAPIQAYGIGVDGVTFDRVFAEGEILEWEGFRFSVDWMPGQTEFALCLAGEIDGRLVAFTGDNIFADAEDPLQDGHEALVARNSGILEEGYIYAAEYLHTLQPDILLGGHSYVMDQPAALIDRYRAWAYAMREMFDEVSPEADYRYWFDPFWVRAEPYRVQIPAGGNADLKLHIRNFENSRQSHRVELHLPPGLGSSTPVVEGELAPESRAAFPIKVRAETGTEPGVYLIGLDIVRNGKQYGQRFDILVQVVNPDEPAKP